MASSKGWSTRPLKDCAVWYSGGTPNKSTPRYWGGTIPWISAKSITGFFIADSEDRVTDEGARNGTRLMPTNTILFIVRGMSLKSEFRMGITTRPVTFNQDLKALVAVEDVVPAFLAYAIKARTDEILGLVGEAGHGTGVLPTDRIQSLEIPIPALPEQRAIAHILGTLDDKIELNRRMNETLEAMARALFKSWFVDFDPVRAKAEGRAPSGMDAETAKLFPSEFVNSEMGAIPKGWRTGTVANLAALEREVLNPTAFANEMFDHYSLPAFDAGRRPKQERGGNIMSGKLVVGPHCVLLSKLNPHIPRIWMPYVGSAMRSICSTEFLVASPMRDVPREFLFLLFTSEAFSSTYRTFVTGTTGSHQRIGVSSVLGMGIVLPPPAAMNAMATALAPMFDRINRNAEQTRTESTIRDALLPRLLSGEVAIGHAERETEAVA